MYQLTLDPVAEHQISTIPREALRPLAELFTLLETAPWSGTPFSTANPRANMLTHAFGELGLATYLVLEEHREVYLLRLEWPWTPPRHQRHQKVAEAKSH